MDSLMTAAASGMRARMESLDMLANNVANSGTAGFKADREFANIYVSEQASAEGALESPLVEKRWTDYSQGTLNTTANPLDLAISGKGFFRIDTPSGPAYSRNGNFQLSRDGRLVAQDGSPLHVKTPDGQPLKIDPGKSVEVSISGQIRQEGQELGLIETFEFDNANTVAKRGSTYFQWMDDAAPKVSLQTDIHQGMIESSNVPVAESAVRLVSVMRQFEMLQRAVSIGADMNRRSVEEVAKAG